MGLDINAADVASLVQDKELMDAVIQKAVDDPEAMDNLADSIADKLSDIMEDNPQLTGKLLQAAMKDNSLKKRIVKKLIDNLG